MVGANLNIKKIEKSKCKSKFYYVIIYKSHINVLKSVYASLLHNRELACFEHKLHEI